MLFLNMPVLFFLLPLYRCVNVYLYTQNTDLYLFLKGQSGDVRPLNSNLFIDLFYLISNRLYTNNVVGAVAVLHVHYM